MNMMALRKLLSALIVLIMVTSGSALSTLAATPQPTGETIGTAPQTDVTTTTPDDTSSAIPYGADTSIGTKAPVLDVKDGLPTLKIDPATLSHLPVGADQGGVLIHGYTSHRANPKVLLVDDDDSDASNTTTDFDNKGPYKRDTAHFMDEALSNLGIDHDIYLVESGQNGPDYQMMTNYSTIIWMFGYEWGYRAPFTLADYYRAISFMDAGGSLWLMGNAIISSLYGITNFTKSGTNKFADDSFAKKYMGISEFFPWSGMPNPVNTTANAIMSGSEQYATSNYFDEFGDPDSLFSDVTRPVTGGLTLLQGDSVGYWGRVFTKEPVAIAYDSGTWRSSLFNLDISCIPSAADREDIVGKVMGWLGTPTLSLPAHSIMNWWVEVKDQAPYVAGSFDSDPILMNYFPAASAFVHTHENFTMVAHFENHGSTNERNIDVRFIVHDAAGRELANFTKKANVDSKKVATVEAKFQPTRSGYYIAFTNITVANDPQKDDNFARDIFMVAEWMDDLENSTTSWDKTGAWSLVNAKADSNSPTHAWMFKKNGQADTGSDITTPTIDLRFYNTSFQAPQAFQNAGYPNIIFLQFFFKGRMYGNGNDYVDMQLKASNDTNWHSISGMKIDGNTQVGTGTANGDFSAGWYRYFLGVYLGDYAGQTVQLRWHVVKGSQFSQSWWSVDDFAVWMFEEKNVAPWFLSKTPPGNYVEMDVGSSLDLSAWIQDPTNDVPITIEWYENYQLRPDWTGNHTTLTVPQNAPVGDKYHRGNVLNIAIKVSDGLDFNDTFWNIKLMDPRPRSTPQFPGLAGIEINEDQPLDVDMGTWFMDIEGQSWTVTSAGSANIKVTAMTPTVLNMTNKLPNWNGWDNITLKVVDSAGSMRNFTLPVHVLPVNDAPRIKVVQLPDGQQDEYYSFNLTATDVDNTIDQLAWSDDSPMFCISAAGEIAFVPRNADVGYHTFNVTVADPLGARDIVQFTLFIANVNDPPTLRYIPPQTASQGVVFTLDVSTYVEDPDLLLPPEFRDHMTYRDDTPKLETNLETGIVTWDKPTNEDVGDFYFKITVQDSKGRYAEQEVKITVLNVNDPPTIGTIPRQVMHQDSPYVYNIPFADPDLQVPSANEVLTFSNDHHELFTIDPNTGRIQFTPVNNQVGVWEINITVTDVAGASVKKMVVFEVINKNDAPELEYIKVQQLTEDTAYTLSVKASDPDMAVRLVDGLPVDPSERLEYRTNSTRVPIDRDTGLISFTPTNDDALVGDIMVKITVIDKSSETATEDVLFKVTNVNDPPSDLSIVGVVEGQQLQAGKTFQLIGSAKDIDNAQTELTYMWYAGTTVIGQTSTVQWKVAGKGLTVLKLVVSDPDGGSAAFNVTVNVKPKPTTPGFESVAAFAAFVIVAVMVAAASSRRRMH